MSWGKVNESWNHTSSVMALLAAIHTDTSKASAPTPADFHPFQDPPPLPEASPELIRSLFGQAKPMGDSQ